MHNTKILKLKQLIEIHPSFILLFTPVIHCVKMSAKENKQLLLENLNKEI